MTGLDAVGARPAKPVHGRVPLRRGAPQGSAGRVSSDLLAIGPHPPFITGQSIATEALLGHLERSGVRVRAVDTAPRNLGRKWAQRLSRIPRYVRALLALAAGRKAPRVYLALDADAGVYPNILWAALARLRGSRVIAHHHNYSYIARPATRMALLCKAAGPDAVHITLCVPMSRELRQRYRSVQRTVELSNIYTVPLGTSKATICRSASLSATSATSASRRDCRR